jgi:hypothetical protein
MSAHTPPSHKGIGARDGETPERASRSQKLTVAERNVGGDAPTRHARGLFGHHLFVHEAYYLVSPADDGFGEMPRRSWQNERS